MPASPVTVKDNGVAVDVSTGKIRFRINRQGSAIFDGPWLESEAVPLPATSQGAGLLLETAPITMLGRSVAMGSKVMALSSTNGLAVGDGLTIRNEYLAFVGSTVDPDEDIKTAQNRRGTRYLTINPTPPYGRFRKGNTIVIGRGLVHEETKTLAKVDYDRSVLIFDSALEHDHKYGEPVLRVATSQHHRVAEVKDAHRIALKEPLAQPHYWGEIVTREGATPVVYSSSTSQVEVEEAGPLRAVIVLRGQFRSAGGEVLMGGLVEFSARIHAFAGGDVVQVTVTLENNGPYGYNADIPSEDGEIATWLHLRRLSLRLPQALGTPLMVSSEGHSAAYAAGDRFALTQRHERRGRQEKDNFVYEIGWNGRVSTTVGRVRGWVDTHDRGRGVTVALKEFWQNYPKALRLEPGGLFVDLWPAGGHFPDFYPRDIEPRTFGYYQFEGGRHKTHDVFLSAYAGAPRAEGGRDFARSVDAPLIAVAPGAWYADSGALGLIAPAGLTHPEPDLAEAFRRYEQFQRARIHLPDSERPKATIETVREKMPGGTVYEEDAYGWMHFGDLVYGESYSSLHYDWPYVMLLQFLRTGDPKFFELGAQMARHRYDIDQYHGDRGHRGKRKWTFTFLQRYEKEGHGHGEMETQPSHTWTGGLALFYLLTGDRQAWEATLEVRRAMHARWRHLSKGQTEESFEIRQQGWSILNLLNTYRITQDPKDVELALAIAHKSLVFMEKTQGGLGYWGTATGKTRKQSMPMFFWVIDPLIQLHYETRDSELGDLLRRMAGWLREQALMQGDFKDGRYRPLIFPYEWERGKWKGGLVVNSIFAVDLFEYIFLLDRDPEALTLARRLFRDTVFWHQKGNGGVDAGSRSPISYQPVKFYTSETKIGAWMGKHPQVYLYLERLLARDSR
ncbi:MAG: hypothetical protein WAP47_07520 [Candidatus Rokuibacteriota bacterium]